MIIKALGICPRGTTLSDRIDHYTFMIPESTCWYWASVHDKDGYALLTLAHGDLRKVHRLVKELQTGETIPRGMHVDHLCRERGCINPLHLEVVTCAENQRRGLQGIMRKHKTHCNHGHEYTPENTRKQKVGTACKQCERDRKRRAYVLRRKPRG